ncbi:MAG: AraC family transcriptional regulator [Myxococcales bacterium]|nr:AraC family transcriptional regulator [Myxococcales bacterium]
MKSAANYTLPAIHAVQLAEVVERWGVTPRALLTGLDGRLGADLAAWSDPSARLPLPTFIALIERARAMTGEPGLGFYAGLQMRIASHGYLGLAAMTARTIGEALAIAIRFAPTRTRAISLRLDVDDDEAALVLVEHTDLGTARDAFVFALLTGIWKIGDALTGAPVEGSAEVAFDEPAYFARFAKLAPPVRFGRPSTRLLFRRAHLETPLVTGDPAASRLTLEQCERELEALGLGAHLSQRVQALLPAPDGGVRTLDEVARAVHVSPRTLKRRLADEGTSFSALVDAHRHRRALDLLAGSLSLDEIASRLGYSDLANFSRAFRRWTGASPGAWRRARG